MNALGESERVTQYSLSEDSAAALNPFMSNSSNRALQHNASFSIMMLLKEIRGLTVMHRDRGHYKFQ